MSAKKARKSTPHKAPGRDAAKAQRSKFPTTTADEPKPKSKARQQRAPRALEIQFRKTVAELGLAQARKIFASVEAAFED
jgi:hypothetical protein